EKEFHGNNAVKTKIGYGSPSEGMFARRLKMPVKINIVMNGWRTAQPIPKLVCLYRTLMSRQASNSNSSRCAQISESSSDRNFSVDSIRMHGRSTVFFKYVLAGSF